VHLKQINLTVEHNICQESDTTNTDILLHKLMGHI